MTIEELNNKVKDIKKFVGIFKPNLAELQKFFKDNFNKNIIKVEDKAIFDFHTLFFIAPKWKKIFKNDPIQPITITYLRSDLIFYTYDKHPEMGELYITYDSNWAKWLYPAVIKQSELWEKKKYLFEKDPDEYYIQVNSVELDTKYTKFIKDIEFDYYSNKPL